MSSPRLICLLMSTIALALAACRAAPTNVVFEMPDGFTGAFVLRRNAESVSDWRTRGDTLVVEIKGAATEVRSFEPVEGKYLKYEVKPMGSGRYLLLFRLAQAFTFFLVPAWPVNSESNMKARFIM